MIDLALHRELKVAEQAVLRAAILTKKVLASAQKISKADASPVTVADFAAQALLISILHGTFPDDQFVGEEDAGVLRQDAVLRERVYQLVVSASREMGRDETGLMSEADMLDLIDLGGRGQGGSVGRFWVMDPVDGTAAFLRNEQYAVSLALVEDGKECLGVLCCPNLKLKDGRVHENSVDRQGLGVMLSAVKGQGASLRILSGISTSAAEQQDGEYVLPQPQPLPQLTAPEDHRDIHVVDNIESASRSSHPFISQRLTQRLGASYPGTDVWSSHVRYASLIIGGSHALVRVPSQRSSKSYIWDHAGSQLMFREVGGKVTDLEGKTMDFGVGRSLDGNYGLVAATEGIHDRILSLCREIMDERE